MTSESGGPPRTPPRPQAEPEDPAFYEALGRAIKVARTERGMERKDLAKATGLSYAYLSDIESGRRRASSKALLVIAKAMGISPSALMRSAEVLTYRIETEEWASERRAPSGSPPSATSAERLETVAPAAAALEPPSVRRQTWFRGTLASPEPLVERGYGPGERSALRAELERALETLGPEDLELVLDLARRLARERPPTR